MTRNLCLLPLGLIAASLFATAVARADVTVTTVGTPSFQIVDIHLFSANTDIFPDLFPSHFPVRMIHGPPYSSELSDGLANLGIVDKDVFTLVEFSDPNAVQWGFVVVPGPDAPLGSGPDFDNGPIIPNSILPIATRLDVYIDGSPFEEPATAFDLTSQDGKDGRSHFVVVPWENASSAPPGLASLLGNYEYRLTLRDQNNNGYDASTRFQVVPEPGTLLPFLFGLLALIKARRR